MAKHRIIMHRGTVIDADHIAPMLQDQNILLVGINPGTFTHQSHHTHPYEHPDFVSVKHTQPYRLETCVFWKRDGEVPTWREWDETTGEEIGDPRLDGHTDWLVTQKFETILTMHLKNIKSIDGKPVLYVDTDDVERGRGHLDLDEGWSIGRISDLLDG